MLLYILGVVLIFVGLVVSIGLHEIGHLIPAKKFGVKVGQYMIGFGPTLFSRKKGETEYGIKAVPLGGYISMAGMYPPAKSGGKARTASTGFFQTLVQDARTSSADTVSAGDEHRTFYKLATWKRVVIMLGGPTMNLLIAVVLFGILLVGFGIPQATTTIGGVSTCVLPATSEKTTCEPDDSASPAAASGLLPGDRIVSIDGTAISSSAQATAVIRRSAGDELSVVVERKGANKTVAVTPLLTERAVTDEAGTPLKNADGSLKTTKVGIIGVTFAQATVQQPVTAVLPAVGDNIVAVTKVIVTLPQRLVQVGQAAFGGDKRDPNGPISVVGVGRLAGEITAEQRFPVMDRVRTILGMLAGLNVALFVFNLIPLLPLDGGHVIGALWEALRRGLARLFKRKDPGPVDTAKLVPLTLVITMVIGASSLLLIYADIVNPVSIL